MKSNTIVNSVLVVVGFLITFGAGYLLWGKESPSPEAITNDSAQTESTEKSAEDLASVIPDEAISLSRNGCLSCHSVESIGAPDGDIGPDLSRVFPEIKDKHCKDLDDFLKAPTSAVMATIIADKPLKDDERKLIVAALKDV